MLDPFTARAIRERPANLITLKLGIDVVNHDCFRRWTFAPAVDGFLDTIREGHPTTPIVVMSGDPVPDGGGRPGSHLDRPGVARGRARVPHRGGPEEVAEGKLSLRAIRAILADVVALRAADDPHLTYLDGLGLFGPAQWDAMPMPDHLRPDAAGQRHIGRRFAQLLPDLVAGVVRSAHHEDATVDESTR